MKQYEFRETRGFCRLCETSTTGKAVVIPFRANGKVASIILCVECINHLHTDVNPIPAPPPLATRMSSYDDYEPVIRFFRD